MKGCYSSPGEPCGSVTDPHPVVFRAISSPPCLPPSLCRLSPSLCLAFPRGLPYAPCTLACPPQRLPRSPSHGQRLELRVADPGTEAGMDKLQIALADLIVTTALLQEVNLGRYLRRGSLLEGEAGGKCVAKAYDGIEYHRITRPGFNSQICCLLAV